MHRRVSRGGWLFLINCPQNAFRRVKSAFRRKMDTAPDLSTKMKTYVLIISEYSKGEYELQHHNIQ